MGQALKLINMCDENNWKTIRLFDFEVYQQSNLMFFHDFNNELDQMINKKNFAALPEIRGHSIVGLVKIFHNSFN